MSRPLTAHTGDPEVLLPDDVLWPPRARIAVSRPVACAIASDIVRPGHHRPRSRHAGRKTADGHRTGTDVPEPGVMRVVRVVSALTIVGILGSASTPSWGDAFPSRPLRLVLGFPAGGTPDALARSVSSQIETSLGRPVVIDNRSGANGIIAAQLVARAAPDGYTLLFSPPALIINQIIHPKAPYDVLTDFIPVANACMGEGSLLVVNPAVPAHSVAELVALSKKGKPLTYGSPGIGNTQHLVSEMFNVRAAARMMHVPYKGLPPAINGVLTNEVNVLFAPPAVIVQHIKAGRLRALAFTGASRWSFMPEIPTIAESGIPGFQSVGSWMGFFIPAKTPTALVRRLNTEVRKAVQIPQVRDFLRGAGYEPDDLSPEAFRALIASDLARYAEVVRIANIKAE